MKKVAVLLAGSFPYCVPLVGVLLWAGVIRKPLTDVSFLAIIGAFAVFYGLARLTLRYILREVDNRKLIRLALGLKWAHMPAHLFNIVCSVLFYPYRVWRHICPFFNGGDRPWAGLDRPDRPGGHSPVRGGGAFDPGRSGLREQAAEETVR